MRRTRIWPGRRYAGFCIASSRFSASRNTRGWQGSQCPIYTISGTVRPTRTSESGCSILRADRSPLERDASPIRSASRDTCGSTRTVHQGQKDGKAGVYHINAVDTVTQWQNVGCVETISERHMLPVLEAMLHQFPFRIMGFHCNNGSEFLNKKVAKMLGKLLVEFTKSRAYRTTDNALVEGKNGAVIRKHVGYGFIGGEHAGALQRFFTAHFNPYLNFHRPCGFAVLDQGPRGRIQRRYRADDYRTPFEKLTSLNKWEQYLKPGMSGVRLKQQAGLRSDTEAAQQMQKAKLDLLKRVRLSF
jgi:hypothetical protein